MVTETLILRPCDICKTISGLAGGTHYPETDVKKHYLLLSEEQADDDASYVIIPSSAAVAFALPENHLGENPSSVTIYCRHKVEVASEGSSYQMEISNGHIADPNDAGSYNNAIRAALNTDSSDYYVQITNLTQPTTEYNTLVFNVPSDTLSQLDFSATNIHLFVSSYLTGGKNTPELRTTQMYVEITYGDGTTETTENICLKENGSWTSVPCTIYQKQNGAWVKTDSTIFENGDKYILQKLSEQQT